jgi:hypothetical protein
MLKFTAIASALVGTLVQAQDQQCMHGSFPTRSHGCVRMCDLGAKCQEVVDRIVHTDTMVLALNVTCDNAARQLDICNQDVGKHEASIIDMQAQTAALSEMCAQSVADCQTEIDNCADDAPGCTTVTCGSMESACGQALTVPVSTNVDEALKRAIVASEFDLWGTMPCFMYHRLREVAYLEDTPAEPTLQGIDEAECWDTCSASGACMTAVFDGEACWHKDMDATVENVVYAPGRDLLVPCVERNESMYTDLVTEVTHMGEVIVYYSLEANSCWECEGHNKLIDIDTAPGMDIGTGLVDSSEDECWMACAAYSGADGPCVTAVWDGMSCAFRDAKADNTTARYVPGVTSLYACPELAAAAAPAVSARERALEIEVAQFKLADNAAEPCDRYRTLADTDVTTGEHILKACLVESMDECWDLCEAFTGDDAGPCVASVYKEPSCWLKKQAVTTATAMYAPGYTTAYACTP